MSTPAKPLHSNLHSISKVRVIVRVRPFLSQEISARGGDSTPCASVLETVSGQEVTVHLKDHLSSRNECYKLDSYFPQDDDNVREIYDKEVSPLIPGIFHGCNATVFAYGATGSGKTYTMQGTNEIPGLIPLAMSTILSLCQSTGSTIEISYYEVYLDKCYDLMEVKVHEIPVLEDKEGHVHLKGLARVPVSNMSEFGEMFSCGNQRRKVAHTALNDVSSRSHAVLSITVSTPCDNNGSGTVVGKLNLIDLAGNEDNRRTCNQGIRLQESSKINQSLFTLSNVIYALNNNKPRVPYRESKLTRILQDSLGGTSRAVMVACLNPGEYQEAVHTVSLAARSRQITNYVSSGQKTTTPKVKVDMEAKLNAWLESKGKTKSTQKMAPFGSPFLTTPSSVRSTMKPSAHQSNAKKKTQADQASSLKERCIDDSCRSLFDNLSLENLEGLSQENCGIMLQSTAVTSKENEKGAKVQGDPTLDQKPNTPVKSFDSPEKMASIHGESPISEKITSLKSSLRKVVLSPIDHNIDSMSKIHGESPISEKITPLKSSLRKVVLSPIDHNIDSLSKIDQSGVISLDPKTPKTPFPLGCGENSEKFGTPLNKFSAMSSNLKGSLVQEYIDVLNNASREELMELKGIGQKMASYILELRETSPLKSLGDLEKLGLSSKQVFNMFNRTARAFLQYK